MKNRVIALALAVLLMAGAAGCGSGGGLRIVVTAFPVYDWVRTILGEDTDAELVWLTDDGASLHGYEPSEEDLKTIADCDVFIYIGGPSDDWAEEAASRIRSRTATVIDLMDALGSAVGLEQDPDAGAYDEHVWLSLQNARVLTAYIAAVLEGKDPKHAEAYAANTEAYDSELMMLDMKYVGATRSAEPGVLLFGGPFAFRYMLRDYFLEYAAAFEGCPGGTAVSAETIASLAAKADELGLRAVIAPAGADDSAAKAVAAQAASGPAVVYLDTMESVTAQDAVNGKTYLSVMEDDLAALRQALGRVDLG